MKWKALILKYRKLENGASQQKKNLKVNLKNWQYKLKQQTVHGKKVRLNVVSELLKFIEYSSDVRRPPLHNVSATGNGAIDLTR